MRKENLQFNGRIVIYLVISVLALILTFLISVSSIESTLKIFIFIGIVLVYTVSFLLFYLFQSRQPKSLENETENKKTEFESKNVFSPEIEEKLLALEETNTLFGASLKPVDMFRLVSNRINEILKFTTSIIFLADENKENLRATYVFGKNSSHFSNLEIKANDGLISQSFQTQKAQIDEKLTFEKEILPVEVTQNLKSGIACPLISNNGCYGILALYSDIEQFYDANSVKIIKAIGERISPLFLNSLNFERNLNNALVDSLTNLPNERALFFVLENQIAESQRLREQRPLTVLSIDIQEFTNLNNLYGHGTGDRILKFAAEKIKAQLRQMDFIARVSGDEFLAVLPTSTKETSEIIINRIEKNFENNPYIVVENEKTFIRLHFGTASFLTDGETADDLLKIARIRKQEAKSPIKSSILWFPKEYSN